MLDKTTTVETLKQFINTFIEARDWHKFHNPKNMSMQIATEAAELMELLLWCDSNTSKEVVEQKREAIEQEVADIAITLFNLCQQCNIDLSKAIENKMAINAKRYPLEKAKGNCLKYTQLQ